MQYGYRIIDDLCDGLSRYMEHEGVDKLEDLVGIAVKNIIPAENLDRDYKVFPEIDLDKCVGCGRCYISCYDGAHQAMMWDEEERRPRREYKKDNEEKEGAEKEEEGEKKDDEEKKD